MAQLLTKEGSYQEALDAVQKSYSLHPSRDALLTCGIIYYLQMDFDAAIHAWERILEASPRSCQIYVDIGMARIRQGEIERAREVFKRSVTASPQSSLGYYGLGLAHYFAGDFVAARQEAQRAEAIDKYPPVILLLAQLDFLEGDIKQGNRHAGQYYVMQHKHIPNRSMVELGFSPTEDFNWDPFLADNFDDGYLVLAREERGRYRRQDLNREGHLTDARRKAQAALADSGLVDSDSMQRISAVHHAQPVLSAGISHALNGDLYVTHELGLLKLSEGD
ncbi:MAG: tetratricopeptide repeat protein, partial [Candidatus Saccharimonadales bacterium]